MQSTNYAIFRNSRSALLAHNWLRERLGDDAELTMIDEAEALSHHVIPLCMTQVRRGALGGGVGVAVVAGLVLAPTLVGLHAAPIIAPVATIALCVALAAILGALAGALSFSSDSNTPVQKLQDHLGRHHSIVLFPGPEALQLELERFGAIRVGALV